MLEQIFVRLLNMSLTAGIVILAVLFLRLLLRRAPKLFSYCLWAVVLFRLLCPVSFSAGFSLIGALPSASTGRGMVAYIPEEFINREQLAANLPVAETQDAGNTALLHETGQTAAFSVPAVTAGAWIWIAGMLIMAAYSVLSLLRLKKRLRTARPEKENIYITEKLQTPFVIGLFCPRIYLPAGLGEVEKEYILLHERTHIKRGDHLLKLIGFLTLCLHWFNPLVWAAFFLSGQDMEMSCDEAVLKKIGNGVKKEYSTSLLSFATGRRIVNGVPLAFGEGDTGSRIKNVLRYKKPAVAVICTAVVICIIAAFVLLANPGGKEEEGEGNTPQETAFHVYGVVVDTEINDMTQRIIRIPGMGDVEIPEAEEISIYFERDEQELLAGDVVHIAFPKEEEVSLMETYPAGFTADAESIVVMWSGCFLEYRGEDAYRFTFPAGIVPDGTEAVAGDMLEISMPGYGVPEILLASTPVLALSEGKEGIPCLTVELKTEEIEGLLADFGSQISFELVKKEEVREVNIRSVSESARCIDAYVAEETSSYDGGEALYFAEDCVFQVNYSMTDIQFEEVTFDTFAGLTGEEDDYRNHPCLLTFEENLIVKASLLSAYDDYGITFSAKEADTWYEDIKELEGGEALTAFYSRQEASVFTADVSDREGEETIEVYTGDMGDGNGGVVLVLSGEEVMGSESAHAARAGWNNIYLGEADGGNDFLMTVMIEDRDDSGVYGYWVYRLGEEGEIRLLAGSTFTWGEAYVYDDELFREWADKLTYYLENSFLLLGSQDGEIRTEHVSEAEKYNYDTLRRK